MKIYKADEGKVFTIPGSEIYAKTIYLGKGDSIDRYILVDEPVINVEEQERELKVALFKELLYELYPDEEDDQ